MKMLKYCNVVKTTYLSVQFLKHNSRNRIGTELVRGEVAEYPCYQGQPD